MLRLYIGADRSKIVNTFNWPKVKNINSVNQYVYITEHSSEIRGSHINLGRERVKDFFTNV